MQVQKEKARVDQPFHHKEVFIDLGLNTLESLAFTKSCYLQLLFILFVFKQFGNILGENHKFWPTFSFTKLKYISFARASKPNL
jgi:hypothetical protein